jgi:pullulanase
LRSKKGEENSFKSPDSVNAIDWNLKSKNKDVFDYVRHLIKMRKAHPAFRMKTAKEIAVNIRFREQLNPGLVVFEINGAAVGDKWKRILVCFNGSEKTQPLSIGQGWQSYIFNNQVIQPGNSVSDILLSSRSCSIFFQ